jgi:predicted secreted protein
MAGFSADGDYFIYLESSRDTGAGIPKSTMQVVALDSNTCVKNGCLKTRYGEPDSDLSLEAAEDSLLKQTWNIRQDLQLTPPAAGDSLPVLSRSRTADGTETMTVRLANHQPLQLRLQQKRIPATQTGQEFTKDRAAMQIEVNYDGQRRSLGSLDQFRDWVLDYSIRDVKLSPDGKHVVVLVTAMQPTFEGTLGTTVVQGFEL